MPSSSSAGPRFVAAFLIVGIVAAATWMAWPANDPHAAPTTAPAGGPADTKPAPADAATGGLVPTNRTAVAPTPPPPVAAADPTPPAAALTPPAAPAAILRGRVVDARNAPIAAAKVASLHREDPGLPIGLPKELLEKRSDAATTDANGAFSLPLAALGPFELVASHDERPEAHATGVATAARVDDVVIVMQEGGTIRGTVVGVPAATTDLLVVARPTASLLDTAAREATGMLFDIGDFVEDLAVSPDARQAKVTADGTFAIRGLDVAKSYRVYGTHQPTGALPVRCTERLEVRPGAPDITLRWRETLDLLLRVVDAESGAPLESLDVEVGPVHEMKVMGMRVPVPMRQPLAQHHFADGIVRIGGLGVDDGDAKRVSVEVRAAGHRPWSRDDIDVAARGTLDLGVVRLGAAPIVRVRVTDARGPVAGATVQLLPAADNDESGPRRSMTFSSTVPANDPAAPAGPNVSTDDGPRGVKTDAAGVAEVTSDFAGRALVEVESAAHARFRGAPFALPDRGIVEQSAALVAGGTVRVQARDGRGAPLANATIRRRANEDGDDETSQRTDAAGIAVFARVPPGPHRFDLREPDADSPFRVGISLGPLAKNDPRAKLVDVIDGETTELELTAPLRGSVRGVVRFDGQPLDRAEVRIGDVTDDDRAEVDLFVESMLGGLAGKSAAKAKTDVDGAYVLENVEVGERRLIVTHRDLAMPTVVDVRLVEGDNEQDIAVHGATLRGRVIGDDGKPVEGATVAVAVDSPEAMETTAGLDEAAAVVGELFGGTQRPRVRTDADGRFELRGVRPGRDLRVIASARLHVTASVPTPAITDGTARDGVELRLAPAGRIHVKANGANAVAVEAEWAGDAPLPAGVAATRTALLKNGRATLDGVPPGPWRLRLEGPDDTNAPSRTVTVAARATVDADF